MISKYYISVGEPWDFSGPDGENIINGEVTEIVSLHCLIFKSNYVFDFKGKIGDTFILTPRYAGEHFGGLFNDLEFITVNGALLLEQVPDVFNESDLQRISKFVLSGSLRK